jgi:Tol biopolymer transport system component
MRSGACSEYNAESMYSERRKLPLPLFAVLGVLLGLLLAAFIAAPRVVKLQPAPGSQQVSSGSRLSIQFNQPMDRLSVESRLKIDPNVPGQISWQGNTLIFVPGQPWPEGAVIKVRLEPWPRSVRFLPLLKGNSWSFQIGASRIIYLWPAGGPADLYARSLDGQQTTRLTESSEGVTDFSLGEGGSLVIYTALRADGGSDIHSFSLTSGEDLIVYRSPQGAICRAAAISPDARWVAFEQADIKLGPAGTLNPGPARVWLLPLDGAEAYPVGPQDHVSQAPGWSPAGWLSYRDSSLGAVALVSPQSGVDVTPFDYIPDELGESQSWSPDGANLLRPEIVFLPESSSGSSLSSEERSTFYSHLYRVNVQGGQTVDLSGVNADPAGDLVEDASPAYAPSGHLIAFARKYLDNNRWSLGRQLWVMNVDGSGARALTNEPDYNHSAIAWSPDSTLLVYMRFNQANMSLPAEIWLIGSDGSNPHRLVTGGYAPQWLP